MSRIYIDDLPMGENLTPEQEELILGAGRQTFRPTLESLENREMMDAGIGGALMHPLPNLGQGAQIRLLAQETSATQNQSNPLPQSLPQPGQALLAQGQQLNANWHAAADRIFSAWAYNVDQVVQNVQALQHGANRPVASSLAGLPQGQQDTRSEGQILADNTAWAFDHYVIEGGALHNRWLISKIDGYDWKQTGSNKYEVHLKVMYWWFGDKQADINIELVDKGVYGEAHQYEVTNVWFNNYNGTSRDAMGPVVKEIFGAHSNDLKGQWLYDPNSVANKVKDRVQEMLGTPHNAHLNVVGYSETQNGIQVDLKSTDWEDQENTIHVQLRQEFKDSHVSFVVTKIWGEKINYYYRENVKVPFKEDWCPKGYEWGTIQSGFNGSPLEVDAIKR